MRCVETCTISFRIVYFKCHTRYSRIRIVRAYPDVDKTASLVNTERDRAYSGTYNVHTTLHDPPLSFLSSFRCYFKEGYRLHLPHPSRQKKYTRCQCVWPIHRTPFLPVRQQFCTRARVCTYKRRNVLAGCRFRTIRGHSR